MLSCRRVLYDLQPIQSCSLMEASLPPKAELPNVGWVLTGAMSYVSKRIHAHPGKPALICEKDFIVISKSNLYQFKNACSVFSTINAHVYNNMQSVITCYIVTCILN